MQERTTQEQEVCTNAFWSRFFKQLPQKRSSSDFRQSADYPKQETAEALAAAAEAQRYAREAEERFAQALKIATQQHDKALERKRTLQGIQKGLVQRAIMEVYGLSQRIIQ